MSNRKILITAFALSSTLAFCLQPGWSQTSGGSSSGSSSQGLGTGSSGSGTSGSTGNSGSISGRSGSSSARSTADCQTAVLLQARVRVAALVQLAKAPVGAPKCEQFWTQRQRSNGRQHREQRDCPLTRTASFGRRARLKFVSVR